MRMPVYALALVAGTAIMSAASPATASPTRDAPAATQFVREFFAAFDSRDVPAIRRAFAEGATIVHDDGVEQTVPELIESVQNAAHWYPRKRDIAACDAQTEGKVVIAGCINRVEFQRPDGRESSVAYNETWILRRTDEGLKAIRTHYSRIRKTTHVE